MGNGDRKIIGPARASPTKEFFVRMLTRDIELADAILDLLDNCLDGILRSDLQPEDAERPYAGYRAVLTLDPGGFMIEDNCGGIPIDTARRYAFAMGRPAGAEQEHGTIGMYGIGMKRAIFKLGSQALVESRHGDEQGFFVEFTPEWMQEDTWEDLTVYELPEAEFPEHGTRITMFELNPDVATSFADAEWIAMFRATVARHYSLIIAKGFEVIIGSTEQIAAGVAAVSPEPFRLLYADPGADVNGAIQPFVYRGEIDGVVVEVYAGLYRPTLSAQELEQEESARGSRDDAGWTVACNDRVVIWKDKTRLTGWGEASVPNYHGQFLPITGIVLLYSDEPRRLPLTTTKRGIDASSNVYSSVKDIMRDATKELTAFTNRWKKFPEDREVLYRQAERVNLSEIRRRAENVQMNAMRRFEDVRRFAPTLPEPARRNTTTRISFLAERTDVQTVSRFFFDGRRVTGEEVGRRSFEYVLAEARRADE